MRFWSLIRSSHHKDPLSIIERRTVVVMPAANPQVAGSNPAGRILILFVLYFQFISSHLYRILVAPCSKVLVTVKTVTVDGTGTKLTFQAVTIPKLPPAPPLIAPKRSSPMAFQLRILPLTSSIRASMRLSGPKI